MPGHLEVRRPYKSVLAGQGFAIAHWQILEGVAFVSWTR